jgi:hypothetical protein
LKRDPCLRQAGPFRSDKARGIRAKASDGLFLKGDIRKKVPPRPLDIVLKEWAITQ